VAKKFVKPPTLLAASRVYSPDLSAFLRTGFRPAALARSHGPVLRVEQAKTT
jgi:hypothetical protein